MTPGLSFDEFTGAVRVVGCPKFCHGGYRGMDGCNTCGQTGSGFYHAGKFYPNTEEGFREAYKIYVGQ